MCRAWKPFLLHLGISLQSQCREREIFTSLISSPIMTQPRSLSGLAEDQCLPTSPAFASPLVSSMVCAASLVSSPAAQIGPSIGFTFTPSIPLIEEGPGEAANLTCATHSGHESLYIILAHA